MDFQLNHPFIFGIGAVVVIFVLTQSFFFLNLSIKRARELNISKDVIKRIILSTAVFTIPPAVAILLGVLSLSKFLGLPMPWIRLSILGAITYELTAAASAATTMGISVSNAIQDPQIYTTIVWVMTLGIIPSMILIPIFLKPLQNGLVKLRETDKAWSAIFMDAMFLGMISAFLGFVFGSVTPTLGGMMPIFVLLCSALIMIVIGLFVKKAKVSWLEDFALPISILGAMTFAVLIYPVLVR